MTQEEFLALHASLAPHFAQTTPHVVHLWWKDAQSSLVHAVVDDQALAPLVVSFIVNFLAFLEQSAGEVILRLLREVLIFFGVEYDLACFSTSLVHPQQSFSLLSCPCPLP